MDKSSVKIAIIDDARVARMLMKSMMSEVGYSNFVEATNGQEGWDLIVAEKPDIVFCDMKMDVMNGLELLEKVRATPATASLPFVMVTAERLESDVQLAQEKGVSEYLTKPYGATKLLAIIGKYF